MSRRSVFVQDIDRVPSRTKSWYARCYFSPSPIHPSLPPPLRRLVLEVILSRPEKSLLLAFSLTLLLCVACADEDEINQNGQVDYTPDFGNQSGETTGGDSGGGTGSENGGVSTTSSSGGSSSSTSGGSCATCGAPDPAQYVCLDFHKTISGTTYTVRIQMYAAQGGFSLQAASGYTAIMLATAQPIVYSWLPNFNCYFGIKNKWKVNGSWVVPPTWINGQAVQTETKNVPINNNGTKSQLAEMIYFNSTSYHSASSTAGYFTVPVIHSAAEGPCF